MSDFIDSEAEESEEELEEKDLKPKKTQRFLEEDGKKFFGLKDFSFPSWSLITTSCQFKTDEEEDVDNPEEQDEHGNLRGLIDDGDDDGDEEEEEAPKSGSGGGSDSEEEVRRRHKKRSKFFFFLAFIQPVVTSAGYYLLLFMFHFHSSFYNSTKNQILLDYFRYRFICQMLIL